MVENRSIAKNEDGDQTVMNIIIVVLLLLLLFAL